MNIKILKYELFTLFFLTVTTLIVFYYKDTLPDNYLAISSSSSHGFFAYYGTSFLNFINYYSGPWVIVPCAVFTSFYVLVFSKRADMIDVLNIFSLTIFSLFTIFYFQPSLLGAGLFQILDGFFSAFSMFMVWLASAGLFLWGSFRGDLVSTLKLAAEEVKKFDYKATSDRAEEGLSKIKNLLSFKETAPSSEKEENASQAIEMTHKKEETAILLSDDSQSAESQFLVPITEIKKIEIIEPAGNEADLLICDDDEYVEEVKKNNKTYYDDDGDD